jgi:hypothetical protein
MPDYKKKDSVTMSVPEELHSHSETSGLSKNRVLILRPQEVQPGMNMQRLDGGICLVFMGTSPGSAVVMVRYDLSRVCKCIEENGMRSGENYPSLREVEEDYMRTVRKVVKLFLDEPDLFHLPLAWLVLSHDGHPGLLGIIQSRTTKVFQHLQVPTGISVCDENTLGENQLQSQGPAVSAIRNGTGLLELYVRGRLLYP